MTPGHIADFQLWDKAFSDAEVLALKCGLLGNVVRFEDMEVVGEDKFHHGEDFQCACLMMWAKSIEKVAYAYYMKDWNVIVWNILCLLFFN